MRPDAGGLSSGTRVAPKVESFMCGHILSSPRPQEPKARPTRAVSLPHSGLREGNLLTTTSFLQIKPEVGRFELISQKKPSLGRAEGAWTGSRGTQIPLAGIYSGELVQRCGFKYWLCG